MKNPKCAFLVLAIISCAALPVHAGGALSQMRQAAGQYRPAASDATVPVDDREKAVFSFAKSGLSGGEKKISTDILCLLRPELLPPGKTLESHTNDMIQQKHLVRENIAARVNDTAEPAPADMVYVYIYLVPGCYIHAVDDFCWRVTDVDEQNMLVVAYVAVARIVQLAGQECVRAVRTVLPPVLNKLNASEGDGIHRSDAVRALGKGSGAGIKVGVISDGVTSRDEAQATGDLPEDGAGLTVLSDTRGGDEGTAMLEIVNDLAPEAELYFHDCGANVAAFNSAIDALIAAGCKVIVDDIGWILEPFFEQGTVGGHVAAQLAAHDIIYVSSAGNAAAKHHQKTYAASNGGFSTRNLSDYSDWHNFSISGSTGNNLYVNMPNGSAIKVVLQWNDAFGASANDFDLFLHNAGETVDSNVLAYSTATQSGSGDPLEAFIYTNTTGAAKNVQVSIGRYSAASSKILEVFVYPYGASVYANNVVAADSIFGHAAVPGVLAVGAIAASDEGNDDIEYFSSQGPVTLLSGSVQKPDLCGIDGVTVTGAGGFASPFYGTSAAAPHVAAIAAQLWSDNDTLGRDEVKAALVNNAVDQGVPGAHTVFGSGRADAYTSYLDLSGTGYYEWEWHNPEPCLVSSQSIWGASASDMFVVRNKGFIAHYDGSSWSTMTSGTTENLRGLWGSSGSDVFAVGSSGTILHYDGTSWSAMASGTTNTLRRVWGSSASDVFAVGESGTILHYDGSSWSAMTSGTTSFLYDVWGSSGSDVYALGDAVYHYDGTSWSAMAGSPSDGSSIWGASGSDIFIGCWGGEIYHYDGASWSAMASGATRDLYGLWGSSGSDVFAVGVGGTIQHYDGSSWSTMASGMSTDFYGVWGTSASEVFACGQVVSVLQYDGSTWSPMESDAPSEGYILRRVWAASASDVFAAVDGGTILHHDGTGWSAMTSGTTEDFWGLWGSSGSDVFTVGDTGMILHYDGTGWSAMASGTFATFRGVWGSSGSDVFAVGSPGAIWHYNGSSWSAMTSGTSNSLYGVWGSSGSDVFAVGWGGTIRHYNGSSWSALTSGTSNSLYGVWGSSGSDVFAVGSSGTILHYDGTSWSAMASGTSTDFYGVWGSSAGNVFAVGSDGIYRYSDGAWAPESSGAQGGITGIWGLSVHDVYTVSGAEVLHGYLSPAPPAVTTTTSALPTTSVTTTTSTPSTTTSVSPTTSVSVTTTSLPSTTSTVVPSTTTIPSPETTTTTVFGWQYTIPLTFSRYGHRVVAYNEKIYVTGGSTQDSWGGIVNTVQYADINSDGTLGAWYDTASFPYKRTSHTAHVWNGYIYIIAGWKGWDDMTGDIIRAKINNDGTLDAWESMGALGSGQMIHAHASAIYNDYIYVMGGWYYSDDWHSSNEVLYAKINTDGTFGSWTSGTQMTSARSSFDCFVYDGSMYVLDTHKIERAAINADGSIGTWQTATTVTQDLTDSTVFEYNGCVFILGGGGTTPTNQVLYGYINNDGTIGTLSEMNSFTTARDHHDSIVINDKMYVVGGFNAAGNYLADVQYATLTVSMCSTTTIPVDTTTSVGSTTTTGATSSVISTTSSSVSGGDTTTTTVAPGSTSTTTAGDGETTTTTTAGVDAPCPAKKLLGENDPSLGHLRSLRDGYLAKSAVGRAVISMYYENAGRINEALERSPVLRSAARRLLGMIARSVEEKQ